MDFVTSYEKIDDSTVRLNRVITVSGVYPIEEFKKQIAEADAKIIELQKDPKRAASVALLELRKSEIVALAQGAKDAGVADASELVK